MTSATPWSVKGIDPRAREAAREAARRRGLTIGEWLNQAILANEAALAAVRTDSPARSDGPDPALADALAELTLRVDANDRRAALAIGTMDRSLTDIGRRLEAAGGGAAVSGDVDGLLAELREAQATLLHRMRRLEDEDVAALRAEGAGRRDQLSALDENVSQLAEHVTGAEAKTGEALNALRASLASLDEKVAQARPEIDQQELDARFAAIAENLSDEVESARAALAGQLADVLGELRPEEMRAALGDLSKRIAAAERRHAQTIEAVSIEIKRLNESMERRLRAVEARNDDSVAARDQARELAETVEQRFAQMASREAAFADHISDEVGRVADRLEHRVALSEQRGADAIGQIGEQIAVVAERLHERQDRLAADVSDRLLDNEQRQSAHLNDALQTLSGVLEEIEARAAGQANPVNNAMSAFADRLNALEARIAAPAAVPVAPAPMAQTPIASFKESATEIASPATIEPFAAPSRTSPPGLDDEALAHHHEALREVAAHLAAKRIAESDGDLPDTIFVEDIEARFDQAEGFGGAADDLGRYRLADDPFADMTNEQTAEEEELFWGTGESESAPQALAAETAAHDEEPFGSFESESISLSYSEDDDARYLENSKPDAFDRDVFDAGLDLEPAVKNDYLSQARRAAQAQYEPVIPDHAPAKTQKAGLRGLSSLVLWTAAGAVAAALAGGALYYSEYPGAEPSAAAPEALPPDAAPGSIAESAVKATTEAPAPAAEPLQQEAPPPAATETAPAPAEAPARAAPLHPTSAPADRSPGVTLEQAAQRGDSAAQYQLALRRFEEARAADAVALLRRAADNGYPMAQYRLAKAFERGEGVAANKEMARRWTERAAFAGNARAMHDLGFYLASASPPALDEAAAFSWFKRAAELGVADSQFNVAMMYLQGRGAAPDTAQAYFWFQVAAAGGDQDAAARGGMIERQLGAAAKPLRERARAYTARPLIAEANGLIEKSWTEDQLQAAADTRPRT